MARFYAWPRSAQRLNDFLAILPRLGGTELHDWVEDYAEGQGVDRIAWDVEFLSRNYAFNTCLNVGGAPYIFEFFLRKARPDVRLETIDLDASRFPGAPSALDLTVHSIDVERDTPALAHLGHYQCVVLCEVIEHLRWDIPATLAALHNLLTPDGILYLSTPNGRSAAGIKRFIMSGRTGPDPVTEWSKLQRLGHMGHVREYSMVEICDLLENGGYEIEQKIFRFGLRRPTSFAARFRNRLQALLTWVLPSLANELVIVARKKAPET